MAAAVNRLAAAPRLSYIILAGALGYTLPTALLTVIRAPGLAVVVEVFRGSSTLIVDVLAITALQRAIPSDQLARVFGVFFAFVLAAITLGTIITPAIVSGFGLIAGLWVMALGPAAIALAGYPALAAIDRATAARTTVLAPRIAALEAVGLFTGASRPILERLAAEATEVSFEPGTAIVREGDTADAVYVLADGAAEVTARGEGGSVDRPIRTLTAPAFFGEIGVLEHIPRTATVTAAGPCQCVRIAADALLDAFTTTPPSSGVMESTRTHLALTHPSRRLSFEPPAVTTEVG
jgi:CRP-like cAMP-binding protein